MIGPEWIVRSAVSIVLLGCMSVASKLSAQSTLGVTGLLNSPSAEMAADGTVRIGANFLNDRLTPATFDYHTFNYYLNVTFLPFLEVALTSTAFMNERRHGLRQRGPFGFGPRAAARGTQSAARDRGRLERPLHVVGRRAVLDLRRRGQPVFRLDVCRALQAFRLFGPPLRSASGI